MNNLILDFLNSYTANPDPQYAVMLKGKWGCGKTYFIKQWKKRFDNEENAETEITLKPIYVSTYGMKSIAEIKTAIDKELNPFFYSKTGKIIRGALKIAGKIVFKTDFDVNGDAKNDGTFSATLDSLSLLQIENDSIKGVKFLIFDDIERSQIDMKELLGFINYFVEHCGCHVVVIGDDNHLEASPKKVLEEFKEKIIGREFEIQPNIEEAIDCFLNEVPTSEYLKELRDFIMLCFNCTGYNNLRVLRQCLYDFKEVLDKLSGKLAEAVNKENIFLKNVLASFIAVYAEYSNKDNRELICNWRLMYQISLSQDKDENRAKMQEIIDKYKPLNKELIYSIFHPDIVESILRHITKGEPFANFLINTIQNEHQELKPWEKLPGFFDMEQTEFETICQDTINAIQNNEMQNAGQLGYCVAYLSYFDALNIYDFTQEYKSLIKSQLNERITSTETLEELFKLRNSFFAGCNNLNTERVKTPIMDDIKQFVLKKIEDRLGELPDLMQTALETLTEETVDNLIAIDDISYPDHSSTYEMRAIFANINSERLYESLYKLSNKGRNAFSLFLCHHYIFDYDMTDFGDRYKPDLNCLSHLQELMEEKCSTTIGIDKLSYIRLNDALIKAICRCKGESNVRYITSL